MANLQLRSVLRALLVIHRSKASGNLVVGAERFVVAEQKFVAPSMTHPSRAGDARRQHTRHIADALHRSEVGAVEFQLRTVSQPGQGIAIAEVALEVLRHVHRDTENRPLAEGPGTLTALGEMLREASLAPVERAALVAGRGSWHEYVQNALSLRPAERITLVNWIHVFVEIGAFEHPHGRGASTLVSALRTARQGVATSDARTRRQLLASAHPDKLGAHATFAEREASREVFARLRS